VQKKREGASSYQVKAGSSLKKGGQYQNEKIEGQPYLEKRREKKKANKG